MTVMHDKTAMHDKSESTGSAAPRASSSLDELKAAYQAQLAHLAAERDEARRQARRAKAEADVARANLASLRARVDRLLGTVRDELGLPVATDADLSQKKAADAPERPAKSAQAADKGGRPTGRSAGRAA